MCRTLVRVQWFLGGAAYFTLTALYLRRAHGLEKLNPNRRCIFVSNHVSLLDTFLLGSLFWRTGCYPISVLGDKAIWSTSPLKRALSNMLGFLLQRGKLNPARIDELKTFGRAASDFQLVVFPEGTRGDGVNVASSQPGIYFVAQEARLPVVPVFIENMKLVSTKSGRFHPFSGLRKVEVHFGEPIPPEKYLTMPREEFLEFIRQKIATTQPPQPSAYPNPTQAAGLIREEF
jgi:1-acyl-sn-glycerol-3-phosphate acyltransferase